MYRPSKFIYITITVVFFHSNYIYIYMYHASKFIYITITVVFNYIYKLYIYICTIVLAHLSNFISTLRSFPSTALALLTSKDAMSTFWTFICQSYRQQLLQRRVLSIYLRPLSAIPEGDSSPWYTRTPVGRNMLASMLKRMCQRGGIEGHKTNHSLRATGATQLFQAEVPEKIIQERTGHRSLAALRTYERTTSEQHEAVSSLLAARPTVSGPAYINQYRQSKDIQIQQPATSSITIQGCTGCTINIQQPPPQLDPFSLKDIDMDSFLADF